MAQVGDGEGRIFLDPARGYFFEEAESLGWTVGAASGRPAHLAQSGLGAKRREQPRAGGAVADRPVTDGEATPRPPCLLFVPGRQLAVDEACVKLQTTCPGSSSPRSSLLALPRAPPCCSLATASAERSGESPDASQASGIRLCLRPACLASMTSSWPANVTSTSGAYQSDCKQ